MKTTRKFCFYAMESTTWTRGGEERRAGLSSKRLSLIFTSAFPPGQQVQAGAEICELSEEQQTEAGEGWSSWRSKGL